MIDHDRLFKELLSTFFLEFIDLFIPKVRGYRNSQLHGVQEILLCGAQSGHTTKSRTSSKREALYLEPTSLELLDKELLLMLPQGRAMKLI
jgi:hypothetical protein